MQCTSTPWGGQHKAQKKLSNFFQTFSFSVLLFQVEDNTGNKRKFPKSFIAVYFCLQWRKRQRFKNYFVIVTNILGYLFCMTGASSDKTSTQSSIALVPLSMWAFKHRLVPNWRALVTYWHALCQSTNNPVLLRLNCYLIVSHLLNCPTCPLRHIGTQLKCALVSWVDIFLSVCMLSEILILLSLALFVHRRWLTIVLSLGWDLSVPHTMSHSTISIKCVGLQSQSGSWLAIKCFIGLALAELVEICYPVQWYHAETKRWTPIVLVPLSLWGIKAGLA